MVLEMLVCSPFNHSTWLITQKNFTISVFLYRHFLVLISGSKSYRLIASTDKKTGVHTRIIWCCSWTHDSKHFITGSRDGKVAVWGHSIETFETASPLGQYSLRSKPLELLNQSVTAVAVAPVKVAPDVYLVAVGLESGCINIYKWSSVSGETADSWQTYLELDNSYPFLIL
jgi:elongator complex protein 2